MVFPLSAVLIYKCLQDICELLTDEETTEETELSHNTDRTVRSFHGAETDRCD